MFKQMIKQRVAIIGSGITGLGASWLLHKHYDITLFEKNNYIGGHTNTIDVKEQARTIPVDTGFIVYNNKNYPNLVGLFKELNIKTQKTDMSFAFSLDQGVLEYSGSGLSGLFAQKRNWLNPSHWLLLKEILRFNRIAHMTLASKSEKNSQIAESLGDFLDKHRFSNKLREHYLLPMGAAIWSCPVDIMLKFPVTSFLQFFANHGLINIKNRPQWRSVCGGSNSYVKKMLSLMSDHIQFQTGAVKVVRNEDSAVVHTQEESFSFDKVIFACHADQALTLLGENASQKEKEILGNFKYENNQTFLHTDLHLMPKRKAVWSSWNYLAQSTKKSRQQMTVTYWMNKLQNLDCKKDYLVTLNPYHLPRDEHVIAEINYQHPIFDKAAIQSQELLPSLQGINKSWFCGSYTKYGFHEDALSSAVAVCQDFGITPSWLDSKTSQISEHNGNLIPAFSRDNSSTVVTP